MRWTIEGCEVDLERAVFRLGERSGRLTPAEVALLRALRAADGGPVSREALAQEVLGAAPTVQTRAIDSLVFRLRRKIEAKPDAPRLLITSHAAGYRLVAPSSRGGLLERDALIEEALWALSCGRDVAWVGPSGGGRTALSRALSSRWSGPVVVGEAPGDILPRDGALGLILADRPPDPTRPSGRRRGVVTLWSVHDPSQAPQAVPLIVPPLSERASQALFLHHAGGRGGAPQDAEALNTLLDVLGGNPAALVTAATRCALLGLGPLLDGRRISPLLDRALAQRLGRAPSPAVAAVEALGGALPWEISAAALGEEGLQALCGSGQAARVGDALRLTPRRLPDHDRVESPLAARLTEALTELAWDHLCEGALDAARGLVRAYAAAFSALKTPKGRALWARLGADLQTPAARFEALSAVAEALPAAMLGAERAAALLCAGALEDCARSGDGLTVSEDGPWARAHQALVVCALARLGAKDEAKARAARLGARDSVVDRAGRRAALAVAALDEDPVFAARLVALAARSEERAEALVVLGLTRRLRGEPWAEALDEARRLAPGEDVYAGAMACLVAAACALGEGRRRGALEAAEEAQDRLEALHRPVEFGWAGRLIVLAVQSPEDAPARAASHEDDTPGLRLLLRAAGLAPA